MISIEKWLSDKSKFAPLFCEENLIVKTYVHNKMMKLKRNPKFDELMIETVEKGLRSEDWEGIIYLMHWGRPESIVPLYIGKAERKGVSRPVSFNIENIRKNKHAFGRWGHGLAYHIGDLSHAIYQEKAYKKPSKNYFRWVDTLFSNTAPPTLKKLVYVSIISWTNGMKGLSGLEGSVPSVEKELIALTSHSKNVYLLNKDGV